MKQRIYIITVLTVIVALLLSGCTGIGGSKIKDIMSDPGKYDGSEVTVSGKVIESNPYLVQYKISDGSASIYVIQDFLSNDEEITPPNVGDEVTVTGIVRSRPEIGAFIEI